MTRDEWITRFAELLGVDPPGELEVEYLLDLAGVAAHASDRTAAPIACYLVGRAGTDPERGLATAQAVAPTIPD